MMVNRVGSGLWRLFCVSVSSLGSCATQWLVGNGSDYMRPTGDGTTPLMAAASRNNTVCVRILVTRPYALRVSTWGSSRGRVGG